MYNDKLEDLLNEVNNLTKVDNRKELDELKNTYMGKSGKITLVQQLIKEIPNEGKKEFGIKVNEIRNVFNDFYNELLDAITTNEINLKLESERIDVTLPSEKIKRGSKHPMTRIQEEF